MKAKFYQITPLDDILGTKENLKKISVKKKSCIFYLRFLDGYLNIIHKSVRANIWIFSVRFREKHYILARAVFIFFGDKK